MGISLADSIRAELTLVYGNLSTNHLLKLYRDDNSIQTSNANRAFWAARAGVPGSLADNMLAAMITGVDYLLDELGNYLTDESGNRLTDG